MALTRPLPFLALAGLLLGATPATAAPPGADPIALGTAFADLAERVGPTTVHIESRSAGGVSTGLDQLSRDFAFTLPQQQAAERETFDAMEKTFFGRAANAMKVLQVSRKSIGGGEKGLIHRTFKAATNAGARKEYFEAAQERARKAQEREVQNKVVEASAQLKRAQESKFAQLRDDLVKDRRRLKERQSEDNRNVQMLWLQRSAERKETFDKALSLVQVPKSFRERVALEKSRHVYRSEFEQARQPIAKEQDNTQSTAGDQDDGNQSFAPKTPRPKQAETKRLKDSHTQASRKQVIEEVEQRLHDERDRKRVDYIRLRQDTGTPVSEHSTSRDEFKRRKQDLTETRRSKDKDPDRDR